MKKTLLVISTLVLGLELNAQTGIVDTRKANDGELITMEEAILDRSLYPERQYYLWTGEHDLLRWSPEGFFRIDLIGKMADRPWNRPDSPAQDCWENVTPSPLDSGMGRHWAFTQANNLFLSDASGKIDTVAFSTDRSIVSGQIVSRNEFGIQGGIFWAPDGSRMAWYCKDESAVHDFPLLDISSRCGDLKNIKYPMAGTPSEKVSTYVYDLRSGKSVRLQPWGSPSGYWKDGEEYYMTNISWSPDAARIFVHMLDRKQNHQELLMFDAATGAWMKTILTEDNEKYVEPLDPIHFIGETGLFIYRTANRDRYRNLYLCDLDGNIRRITSTDADVAYVGNDGRYLYYTSAEVSPVENHLFRIRMDRLEKGVAKARFRQPERLTFEEGWHEITMSPDSRYFVDSYSSLKVPRVMNLKKADGHVIRCLFTAPDPTEGHAFTEVSLGTVKSADGKYDNWYRLILPKDFDPTKKYPLMLYVYGGPHSQLVRNTFLGDIRNWEMYMAERGYIVYIQDNRGTENRGLDYEQAIHRQCGQAEMADQMVGVRMLMDLPFVDKDRIGVHGWSYGGFMTISLFTNYPEIFKVAVAGGPVIDWKWYEVMYGERYMDSPQDNPEGYEKVSLINKAKDVKGKLLICQGVIDPVVVWENSLSFVRECVKNRIQLDYFPYPRHEHNVIGPDRVHLMDKVTLYFEDYLR